MSDFAAAGLLMALAMLGTCTFVYIHRHAVERRDLIIAGIRGGVPMSVNERRLEVYREWLITIVLLFVYEGIVVIGWMILAGSIDSKVIKAYAYACAIVAFSGVVGAAYQGILGYLQIASALRQAEAH